jgi:hypothetical protein
LIKKMNIKKDVELNETELYEELVKVLLAEWMQEQKTEEEKEVVKKGEVRAWLASLVEEDN